MALTERGRSTNPARETSKTLSAELIRPNSGLNTHIQSTEVATIGTIVGM